MASKLYHEVSAFMSFKNNVYNTISDSGVYKDQEIDLNDIAISFNPYQGDRVKLFIAKEDPPRIFKIEPWDELRTHIGKITCLTQSFGVVDDEIIFYPQHENLLNWEAQTGDEVNCILIDGEYVVGKTIYEVRCEKMEKYDKYEQDKKDADIWFSGNPIIADAKDESLNENVDSDNENHDAEPKMVLDACRRKEPNQENYDLPYGLYETLMSKNLKKIKQKLDSFVPNRLEYDTYKTRFHALIYLEEVEMKASFDKYKSREVWIEPEKKGRFSILCSKISELRPPISVGDKIDVRPTENNCRYYRGVVERVLQDRFILKFKRNFEQNYRFGDTYSAEFYYSRTIFQRKHAAVDYAKRKLDPKFLFPQKLELAANLQLNAELKDGKLFLDEMEVPWFRDNLNDEQKYAIAGALRGECRPLPFIVFGPPGTGKTSTLIELILQVYTHVKDCKLLVATQSNHAANVVATRLINANSATSNDMLRLVSNAVLDRRSLPKELHKVSASVMNLRLDEDDIPEIDEQSSDIKRNCEFEYLKKFKIIIGTCVGLGVMFGSTYSNSYFSHVLIDEAAQCNECEALIPISFANFTNGQIIMAGDPMQLPPITLSNHAKHYNLVTSMLERYVNIYKGMDGINAGSNGLDPRLVTLLRRNYRSLPSILNYYNKQFYSSQLIATLSPDESPEAKKLRSLNSILKTKNAKGKNPFGICFVNVEGRNERMENKKSWENKEEAAIIKFFIQKLMERRVNECDIGIITPYHAQVLALKKELRKLNKVNIGTVEEFQGEEKMVIILSAVKTSGKEKALQFIYCPKRLNTAISRARMLVVIFGRYDLLRADHNWNDLIDYCRSNESFIEGKEIIQIL